MNGSLASKRTAESFLALIADLDGDCREYLRVMDQNARAWMRIQKGANDVLDWGALGFTLHAAYGVLESYFRRVSKFFENDLPRERRHRALLDRMALEIPTVRPVLLTGDKARSLALELLKFRHRFRNLYGEDLDPRKTADVQTAATELARLFPRCHADFAAKLRAIAEGLR